MVGMSRIWDESRWAFHPASRPQNFKTDPLPSRDCLGTTTKRHRLWVQCGASTLRKPRSGVPQVFAKTMWNSRPRLVRKSAVLRPRLVNGLTRVPDREEGRAERRKRKGAFELAHFETKGTT